MNVREKKLITETLEQMQKLSNELSEFRGEMIEFKNSIKERIGVLEGSSNACQSNPFVCSTARELKDHMKGDRGKFAKVFTVLSFCIALTAVVISLVLN